jgi:hypothetical protein
MSENQKGIFNFNFNKLKLSKRGGFSFILTAGLSVILIATLSTLVARANVTEFFSASCLGSWTNPEQAAKTPETVSGSGAEAFNDGNSAVYVPQEGRSIACSGFDGPVEEGTRVLGAKIRLAWMFKYPIKEKPMEEKVENLEETKSLETPINSEEIKPLETTEVEPKTELKKEEIPTTNLESSSSLPIIEPETPNPPVTEPTIESTPSPEVPQAWLISKVFAEENPEVRAELIFDNLEKFLQFDYSLDGENWLPVEDANLSIPILTWEDLRRVHIKITGLRSGEDLPDIYLDSMWLEVEQSIDAEKNSDSFIDQVGEVVDQVAEAVADIPQTVEEFVQTQVEAVPQITEADLKPVMPVVEMPKEVLVFSKPTEGGINSLLGSISDLLPKEEKINISVVDEGFSVVGKCSAKYATILMFGSPEYVRSDPSKALINRAIDCQNKEFSVNLTNKDFSLNLPEGFYYIYVGDQPETGAWILSAGPEVLEVRKIFK